MTISLIEYLDYSVSEIIQSLEVYSNIPIRHSEEYTSWY
jgi:hypothetical protein